MIPIAFAVFCLVSASSVVLELIELERAKRKINLLVRTERDRELERRDRRERRS